MKVLIVASYNKNRYAPFVVEQADSLLKTGCEIEWFGIQGKGIVGYLKAVPKLRAKIRKFRPDIIHAHYGLSCLVANLATRRVPVVSTYHGSDVNVRAIRRFSKMAMRLSAWNIFVSQRNVDIVKPRKNWSLIPCGVELNEKQLMTREEARKVLGWKMEEKKVLFAGAFDNAVKNAELAKQAMNELTSEGVNDVELVELKGYTREVVYTLMCAANCLLMTSKTEGSPQVIKEAMACGCPIVSVDVGDVKERVTNIEGCYVVSNGDRSLMIGNLADALKKAIAFGGKMKGRERILEVGLSNALVAQRIIRIYENILKQ